MTIAPGMPERSARVRATLAAYLDGLGAGRARVGRPPESQADVAAPGAEASSSGTAESARDLARLIDLAVRLGLGDRSTNAGEAPPPDRTEAALAEPTAAVEVGLLVGLACPYDPMAGLVDAVVAAVTRVDGPVDGPTPGAIDVAAAAAVAAGVSCGVDAAAAEQRLAFAAWAADDAAARSTYRPGPRLSARLTWACALAERSEGDPVDVLALLVGTSAVPQECVPAAFALAATHADVSATRRAALALGGQADVITALATALRAGSSAPTDAPHELDEVGETATRDALVALADDLLTHRAAVPPGDARDIGRFGGAR